MPALLIAFVIVAGIPSGLARGQDLDSFPWATMENLKRFQLYTGCSPLLLWVFVAGDDAKAIGLTRDRLRVTAESRLRAAGLYTEDRWNHIVALSEFLSAREAGQDPKKPIAPPKLDVAVEVDRPAFIVRVQLQKTLIDPVSEEEWPTATWATGRYGTHAGRSGHIVQLVAEAVDEFLVEYLRVNEKDCPR